MATKLSAITYDGKAIIPVPMVAMNRATHRTEDGHGVGHTLTATLTGKLVSWMGWDFSDINAPKYYTGSGYPDNSTSACKFDNILQMQDLMRGLFRIDNEYRWFEIQSLESPGSPDPRCTPHKWLAKVQDVQFKEGLWVEVCEYTVTLELMNSAAEYGDEDKAKLMSHVNHSEKWDLQFSEENAGAYKLTHTLSCSAKQFAPTSGTEGASPLEDWANANNPTAVDGWRVARQWINDRLTYLDNGQAGTINPKIDNDIMNFSDVLNNTKPYNYERNENIDQLGGNLSVTETWMMSLYPVIYNVSAEYTKPRDNDYTIKVHGNFKTFRDAANDNLGDAMEAFTAWEAAHKPFTLAQSMYNGARTLNQCPVSRTVTQNLQYGLSSKSDVDGTPNIYGDPTRTVEFTLEYSDGGGALCDSDITVTEKIDNVAASAMCSHTVLVEGNIQGHKCADDNANEPINNALQCLSDLGQGLSLANSIYTGSGTLWLVSSSIAKDERKGTIHFAYEYSDIYSITGIAGVKKEENSTESWDCERRASDGTALKTFQVDGTLTALCEINWEALVAAIPPASDFTPECGTLTKQTIGKDELHKKVSYAYTFEEDCGLARRDIDVTTKSGPDKCAIIYYSLSAQIHGIGCTDALALSNANTFFATFNPYTYVPSVACQLSKSIVTNNHGRITATYEFADYTNSPYANGNGSAEININITETVDGQECGVLKTSINGHIKGCCGASQGAYAAALAAYNALNLQSLCTGYVVGRSKSDNQTDGTISFTLECQERPHKYVEEKTITSKCDVDSYYTSVTIDGSITPICEVLRDGVSDIEGDLTGGENEQVVVGQTAWDNIVKPSLPALASTACGGPMDVDGLCTTGTPVLKRSSVQISKINGKVVYSCEYACLPCQRVPNSIEESIEFACNIGGQVVVAVPILGRACGPIIQDKGTKDKSTYTVTINFKFRANCNNLAVPAGISAAVNSIMQQAAGGCGCPSGCSVTNTYTISNTINWSPYTGKYTQTITNMIECC